MKKQVLKLKGVTVEICAVIAFGVDVTTHKGSVVCQVFTTADRVLVNFKVIGPNVKGVVGLITLVAKIENPAGTIGDIAA